MMQDRAIVTMEDEQETAPYLSNGMVVWMTLSDLKPRFQGHDIIQRQISHKRYWIELCLQWPTNRKSKMICRTAPFSMTLNFQWPWTTIHSSFKVTPFFDAEHLRNDTRYRHSFSGILIGTYTRPTQQCHFQWKRARSLCNSWASCFMIVTKAVVARCSSYSTFVEQRFRCIIVQLQGFVDALKRREQVSIIISTIFIN